MAVSGRKTSRLVTLFCATLIICTVILGISRRQTCEEVVHAEAPHLRFDTVPEEHTAQGSEEIHAGGRPLQIQEDNVIARRRSDYKPGEEAKEQAEYRKELFSWIWKEHVWGDPDNPSGPGSSLEYTKKARLLLETAFEKLHIRSMLDAPCGDAVWIGATRGVGTTVDYTGADIVPMSAQKNSRQYLAVPHMRFTTLDLAMDPIPPGLFDLILTRDALQHLPVQTGLDILRNEETAGAKYLVTNFYPHGNNDGVALEDEKALRKWFYTINPFRPPFNFPKPIMYIMENGADNKYLAVFRYPVLNQGDGQEFQVDPKSCCEVVFT